jgi:prepilin-type processing-associated H-X9-DG protein
MMYVQDYDEHYPYSNLSSTQLPPDGYFWANNTWFWQQLIYPYTKSSQVAVCPSAPLTPLTSAGKIAPYYGNYGVNMLIMSNYVVGTATPYPAVSMAEVQAPASTYMIMDSGTYRTPPRYWQGTYGIDAARAAYTYLPGTGPGSATNLADPATAFSPEIESDFTSGRHFDGVNMAFADGHVKWLKSSEVVTQAKNYVAGKPNSWGATSVAP